MALPDSYLLAPNRVTAYFDAMVNAEPPDRFSYKFLENIGFTNTNDRMLIGVLKDMGFIDTDGVPQKRYFEYLDRSSSARVVADGIRDAYSDLFAVQKNANTLNAKEVENKLRTLYAGAKTDLTISRIAKTFEALCTVGDFSKKPVQASSGKSSAATPDTSEISDVSGGAAKSQLDFAPQTPAAPQQDVQIAKLSVKSLQYHINIILPESRDQSVYDAIFKAMKEHLG